MVAPVNDCDVLLEGSPQRANNPPDSDILLTLSAPAFHVDTGGNPLPSTITVTAHLISLTGFVTFSAAGAMVTDNHDNTAVVAYSSLSGQNCSVTATITVNGETFTRSITFGKVSDGASGAGTPGPAGDRYANAILYQWSPVAPAKPTGTSGWTWATGVNSTYSGNDGWSVSAPTNPGGNVGLWVAVMPITAPSGTASTIVSYASSTVQSWSQNGAQGPSGVQLGTAIVYQWAASIPASPVGTATYTYASPNSFTAPSGWAQTPGTSVSQGMTLWAARVTITDTATATQTSFDWTNAAIYAAGYSGSNGSASAVGGSYETAYCASTTPTATSAPASTTGKNSVPADNSSGITGTWSKTVPTLTAGQYMFKADGIYDPTTDVVTWSTPYWASLKVGSLSAITANLGSINAGNMDIGTGATSWHVDAQGNTWAGASTFAAAPFSVTNAGAIKATTGTFSGQLQAASGTFAGTLQGQVVQAGNIAAGAVTASTIDARGLSIKDAAGNVILDAGSTLAQQVGTNPNLAPRLSSWPTVYGGAFLYVSTAYPSLNGENAVLPTAANGVYVAYESGPLGIPANVWVTVSFTALTEASGSGSLNVDLYSYASQQEIPGITVNPPSLYSNGNGQRYSYTTLTPSNSDGLSRLRLINSGGSGGLQLRIFDVKVEYGKKATHWCDSIITPQNVASVVAPGSFGTRELIISTGGMINSGQTDYNVGDGFCIQGAGNGHSARMSLGAGASRILLDPSASQPIQVINAVISGASLDAFSATLSGTTGGSYPNPSTSGAPTGIGSLTATPQGGRAPYSYSWSMASVGSSSATNRMTYSGSTSASINITAYGNNCSLAYQFTCVVTDANGRVATLGTELDVNIGTPP